MAKLRLTLACGDYEITRALIEGSVQPDGIDLIVLTMPSHERHWRMIRHREFDVCEFSMCQYLVSRGKGEPLQAVPVFPHRRFRHSYIFVNAQAGIKGPKDLEGKRVGLRSSQNSAGLWVRGILQHYYQISLEGIQWITQDEEPVVTESAGGLNLQRVDPGDNINDMLVRGDLSAAIYPDTLPAFARGDDSIKRLFDDPVGEEMKYFRETGIFPIMHTVVIKPDLLEQYPWVARSMQDAFQKAKEICYRRMEDPRKIVLAWVMHYWQEQKRILGDDPWVYGIAENEKVLNELVSYAHEQGLIPKRFDLDELFVLSAEDKGPKYLVKY